MAIITDDSYCSRTFLQTILTDLRQNEMKKKITLDIESFVMDLIPETKTKLYKSFYSFKTKNFGLFVLLVPQHYFTAIFEAAKHFSLLDTLNMWLIPNYKDVVLFPSTPVRVLTCKVIESPKVEVYSNLKVTIPDLMVMHDSGNSTCSKK